MKLPTRRWLLVALTFVEVLLATGIMFGWSALSLAMRRDGVYAHLCADDRNQPCKEQLLRYSLIYTVGAFAVPLSGAVVWGPMLDAYGAKVTRVLSLVTFSAACLLFAFSSRTFDAYLPAVGLISCGGMGFFFSHFVLALHFRNDHYGLVHAIINCAFDGSTVTFTVLEQLHRTLNTSIRNLFVGMACIAALFLLLSTELVWNGHLDAPKEEDNAVRDEEEDGGGGGDGGDDSPSKDERPSVGLYGPLLECSSLTIQQQFVSAPFVACAAWALFTIFRTMFVLGSITEQMTANGGGRSAEDAETLVRLFNFLILVSVALTPAFGRFVDRYSLPAGFIVVNTLGIFCYASLLAKHTSVLCIGFLAFGCFRAWNYGLLTTYVQGIFGGENFGRVYGIGIGVFAIQKSGAAPFLILAALSKLIAMFFKRRNRRRAAQVEMQEKETTAEDDDDDKKAKEEETTTKKVKQRRGKA
ncbi:hypothetical protein PPROV_000623700 [Pycnococcus provasolii]|uniref:Major facilitator superfamily (MFS) profile domain-containing protein n=1 Tax=Pycnococcus provasolii TaxID=41880 RepID=A0A830HLJ1_9CHLO|nr:hypothetical protein PPROV_000623700 [Pycnococcus provasolii]